MTGYCYTTPHHAHLPQRQQRRSLPRGDRGALARQRRLASAVGYGDDAFTVPRGRGVPRDLRRDRDERLVRRDRHRRERARDRRTDRAVGARRLPPPLATSTTTSRRRRSGSPDCRTVPSRAGSDEASPWRTSIARRGERSAATCTSRSRASSTISNPTEFGTLYTAGRAGRALREWPTRPATACTSTARGSPTPWPRSAAIPATLSRATRASTPCAFGGTKNGLAAGEAVLLFPQGDGGDVRARPTRAFDVPSQGNRSPPEQAPVRRGAPFAEVLSGGAGWGVAPARRPTPTPWPPDLGGGVRPVSGLAPAFPVGVSTASSCPPARDRSTNALRGRRPRPTTRFGDARSTGLSRLMCSFDTRAGGGRRAARGRDAGLRRRRSRSNNQFGPSGAAATADARVLPTGLLITALGRRMRCFSNQCQVNSRWRIEPTVDVWRSRHDPIGVTDRSAHRCEESNESSSRKTC